jgi:large subunit ribosomal protein L32e
MTTEPEITESTKASQAQRNKVKLRQRVKANKPKFQGQEVWRYKRIRDRWRRPRGVDSKMRVDTKGWPQMVNVGYGGPKKARYLHPSGYAEVLVHNLGEIEGLDPTTQAIRIAHTVGGRKRMEIIAHAKEKRLHVLNPREMKITKEKEIERPEETEAGGSETEEEETGEAMNEAEAKSKTVAEDENQDNK